MGSSSRAALGRACTKQKAVPEKLAQEHHVCLQMLHSQLTIFYILHDSGVVVYKTIWECDLWEEGVLQKQHSGFHRQQLFQCCDNADKYTASIVLFSLLTLSTLH